MAPVDALREMAGRIATQLVAEALRSMAAGPVTVTIEPVQPRAALPPKPKGRPPGRPKKVDPAPAPTKAAAVAAVLDAISDRACRKCGKRGTAERVPGTDRTVRCTGCRHRWDIREKRGAHGVVSPRPAKPTARPAAGGCVRCDHDQSAHIGDNGKCLVPRCVCTDFYA